MKIDLIAKGVYALVTILLKTVGPDDLREGADRILDVIEDRWGAIGPVNIACQLVRTAFSIPDND